MSSPDVKRRAPLLPVVLTLAVALSLGGCFRPLYGTTSAGTSVRSDLAAIDVAQMGAGVGQERMAHYLRNETVFALNGGAPASDKRYRLEMTVSERIQTAIVDSSTGNAQSATLIGTANYTLRPYAGGDPIFTGKAVASASYDRNPQRFASLRAARDAEILVAKQLAEQIKTQLAARMANRQAAGL
ncbi:LPS-assembly lipoprotein [Hyphomicrobiales bacterium]|nr:LPS-assembly lipoprotein [Hyphomicrobiales bacterium]CAH1679522.1 LPS-assembly lipoprotein [Hyphomicrobiales bacterium]